MKGAAAAINPKIGHVAEMNRNLDEIRQKNLAGKRDIHNKPPSAFKRPAFNKVISIRFLYFIICLVHVADWR